ncbi:MAG: apolipoprotein N-acyltransferase [Thiohalomonadaceae bacterium]
MSISPAESPWRGHAAALAAGGLLPLAFAPLQFSPLAFLALAVLFVVVRTDDVRRGFLRGSLFGLGAFGVGVSWVYVAIHDFGFTSAPVAAVLTGLFVALFALYTGLFGALAAWVGRRLTAPQALLFAMPLLWVAVEWFRGWFLSGFPWLSVGYSQIDTPLAGYAPVLGVYGVSWLAAVSAGTLAQLWLVRRAALAPVAGLLLAVWGLGLALGGVQWVEPEGKPLRVALVQGNLPQLTKWEPGAIERHLATYADLTRPLLGRVDLVAWPENAVTVFYQDLRDNYFTALADEARAAGTDVVLGVPLLDEDGERYYTTMMALTSRQFHRKSHLVPFGEFVPLEAWLRGLIGFFDLPMSGFSPGDPAQPPLVVAGLPAAVTICYEDAFGAEVIGRLPAARLLINGSNNAWYGDSLAPHQHLQIARMRSLETGRPLLRVTTNGISALVDHRGEITARSPQFETFVLDGVIQPMRGATPYVRWGDYAMLALVTALAGALWWRARATRAAGLESV